MERTDWEAELETIARLMESSPNGDRGYLMALVAAAHSKAAILQGYELQRIADALEAANEANEPSAFGGTK